MQAQETGGVLRLEELRLAAADERKRERMLLDQVERVEPPEPLPEMRVKTQ